MKNKFLFLVSLLFTFRGLFGQAYKTEAELQKYLKENIATLEQIEGIWTVEHLIRTDYFQNRVSAPSREDSSIVRKNIAIIKEGIAYKVYESDVNSLSYQLSEDYFSNKNAPISFVYYKKNYEVQYFYPVTVQNFSSMNFKIKLDGRANNKNELFIVMAKNLGEKLTNKFDIEYAYQYFKLIPTKAAYQNALDSIADKNRKISSGFAISADGLIATNYHVIENVKSVKVKGVKGDFSKIYNAKIVASDKQNDLAIIQIEDTAFKGFGKIPYSLKYSIYGPGEKINVLSYPKTAAGINEIVNADGVVTSLFGIDSDAITYQFSTPSSVLIEPSSSGCPVFDKKGFVVGILNVKGTAPANNSFAIKPSYLLSLMKTLPTPPKPLKRSIINKPLAKKIKAISPFIFIIE